MKQALKIILTVVFIAAVLFLSYFNNIKLVDAQASDFYRQLGRELKKSGYSNSLLVISTRRFKFHNDLQVRFSGAAKQSRHLTGDAIDFLVFDVNKDGRADALDVDIVYDVLNKKVIAGKGAIGTYKNENGFLNRQMIHIDNRGHPARWER